MRSTLLLLLLLSASRRVSGSACVAPPLILYFQDRDCQQQDLSSSLVEQEKMKQRKQRGWLDGQCHNLPQSPPSPPSGANLRGWQWEKNSVLFSCSEEKFSEVWFSGEDCHAASTLVELEVEWGECMVIGNVSLKVIRGDRE